MISVWGQSIIKGGQFKMEIKRDYYLNKLISVKHTNLIKIITGIRRCGKSYLLNNLFYNHLISEGVPKNHIIKVALDSIENKHLREPLSLYNYIKEKLTDDNYYYIILDEIQLVTDFAEVLNSFLQSQNVDIYVTGSNSKFLSSDIITEFRGRGYGIKMYPLSFSEFMTSYNGSLANGWKEYYAYGGLPAITQFSNMEDKTNYLSEQKENVYINDVLERNHIKNDEELRILVEIISSSIGSLSNPTKLADTFKSTRNIKIECKTVNAYLKYLEEAFIIEKAKKYDIKGKKYISTPSKYYFTDTGLRNVFVNYRQHDEGHIMENIIYIELRKRGYNVDVGMVETRSNNEYKQLEVDFIANKGNNKYYIQSSLSLANEQVAKREKKSLMKIHDSFKKFVIVRDDITPYRDDYGIITMGIFDFLLDPDSLSF